MSTIQALLVGGILGFIVATILLVVLGLGIGILQSGVEEALREKLNLEDGETKNGSN